MPKPSPITESCRRYFDVFLLNFGWCDPNISANAIPKKRAIAGDTNIDVISKTENRTVVFAIYLSVVFATNILVIQ